MSKPDTTERPERNHDSALLRMLMDNLPDNIYFKDTESRFIALNRSMANWFGHEDPAELIGKTDFDFFSEEHAREAFEEEQQIIRSGEAIVGVEQKETWPDGTETWVSTTKMPLRDESGAIVGTFGLSRDITDRKAAENQLAKFAAELRNRNEALERDLEMARELQASMLPQRFPVFPCTSGDSAVRFHHFFSPSMAVSGDFFDVWEVSSTSAGVFICDVMGHGVRAAMIAAIVRTLIGELKHLWDRPAEFLRELNVALQGLFRHADMPIFVSAFYAVVDVRDGKIRYANAGHPCPLQVRQKDGLANATKLNGVKPDPVLGLFAGANYHQCETPIHENDTLLLFTDGLFEVEGGEGELLGYDQLMKRVTRRHHMPAGDLCRRVIEEVQEFSASHQFEDDVCLVAVEVSHLVGNN